MFKVWLLLLVSCLTNAALAEPNVREPSLFRAEYKADYKGLPISAKGIRELSKTEDGSYLLSSKATALFATITESTEFEIDGGQVRPIEYQYHRKDHHVGKYQRSRQPGR